MRKLVLAAVTLPAALLLAAGTYVAVRVHHSLAATRSQVAEEGKLAFDLATITHLDNPPASSLSPHPLPIPAEPSSRASSISPAPED